VHVPQRPCWGPRCRAPVRSTHTKRCLSLDTEHANHLPALLQSGYPTLVLIHSIAYQEGARALLEDAALAAAAGAGPLHVLQLQPTQRLLHIPTTTIKLHVSLYSSCLCTGKCRTPNLYLTQRLLTANTHEAQSIPCGTLQASWQRLIRCALQRSYGGPP
jgi:hypothetical protein